MLKFEPTHFLFALRAHEGEDARAARAFRRAARVLLCVVAVSPICHAFVIQGPAGELIRLPPPPVDEAAVARAEQAARLRKQAALRDQFELVLKHANAAVEEFYAQHDERSEGSRQLLERAASGYERASKLRPGDWRSFSGLGNVYYWLSRYNDSETAYKHAIALNPSRAELHAELSRTYWYNKKPAQRMSELERAVELDQSVKLVWAHESVAHMYDLTDRCDKAVITYKRLIASQESLPVKSANEAAYRRDILYSWHAALASDYLCVGRPGEAISEFKSAIEIRDSPSARCSLGHAYAEAKRYGDAIETFEGVNDTCATIGLGNVYADMHEYDKAIEAFNRATNQEPNNWEGFAGLGMTYYLQKQYDKSLMPFEEAIKLNSNVPEPHYYSGLSQLQLGHKAKAMQQYEELQNLKSKYAEKLLSEINRH